MTSSSRSPSPPPPPSHSNSPSPPLSPPKHKPLLSLQPKPPKKSPPIPWTHHETLTLIRAYQEKWYSLKKGQMKAFQWEEVSVTVSARCGLDDPSKTSTQCRHKIEKLRKRYRLELRRPDPNSWPYFAVMDQMERGPMPLNACPINVVKPVPNNGSGDSSNNVGHGYGNLLYSGERDCYGVDRSRVDSSGSDESGDDKWDAKNKMKGVDNVVRGDVKTGVRSARGAAMERGFRGCSNRIVRVVRNPPNVKQKQYYDDSDDGDGDEVDEYGNDDDCDDVEEKQVQEEEGGGGMELAAEIRGFTEKFMGMENRKIEMMRETERFWREMERKRMGMILESQRKIIDALDRAFGAYKKVKIAQET